MGVEITFFVDLQTPNVKHFVDFFACQIEFFFQVRFVWKPEWWRNNQSERQVSFPLLSSEPVRLDAFRSLTV